ncbi:MAG TPA: glycosyltransferase family 39 protein [Candidatus Eisenbacteria bacterium]|nr:glycosyltransferase family 39 protein [Candidatus Eisenbacteria bacterium]
MKARGTPAERARSARRPLWRPRHEALLGSLLLAIHAALALWGAASNSVTFDENFHVPDGVVVVSRGDFAVSPVNPPLVKAAQGLAALAAGAKLPAVAAVATHDQWVVGESFMRANADRYHRVFLAARVVVILLSVALGLLVWVFARRLYGPAGGLLALGFYAFSSEALAHAGVATLDLATGLAITAALYAFWMFTRTGSWRWWAILAIVVGLAALTRFTTVTLAPMLVILTALGTLLRRIRRPARVWAGLALLPLTTLAMLQIGYGGRTSWQPLAEQTFQSRNFRSLQQMAPWLRLPVPDAFVRGLDIQGREGQGGTPTYLAGQVRTGRVWTYFPLALLAKWPLGLLAALPARAWVMARRRRRRWHECFVVLPMALLLLAGMAVLTLNIGIRYLFPIVPLVCVWLGGFVDPAPAPRRQRSARRWARLGTTLALLQAIEVSSASPWYLAFFNRALGGVGGGYWLVNDSNVDWGQGLIALREELRRRGITQINLTYHGTTDPAVYGIEYLPYLGGDPDRRSEWIAVSSYYYVGLWQRMTTREGRTPLPARIDFSGLWNQRPVARPAGCIYLYRVER